MTTHWTKEEILAAAAEEGIQISKDMLGKYVTYGLLVGTSHGNGRRRGVALSTYERGMESVRWIYTFKRSPYGYRLQDIIYLLYWRGLPVNYTVLWKKLQAYHQTVAEKMEKAVVEVEDEGDHRRYMLEKLIMPRYSETKSGPLFKHRREEMQKELDEEIRQYVPLMKLLAAFHEHGSINSNVYMAFTNQALPASITPQQAKEFFSLSFLQKSTWDQSLQKPNPKLLGSLVHQLYHPDGFLRSTWMQLSFPDIPAIEEIRFWKETLQLQNRMDIVRPGLYWLIATGAAAKALECLQQEETQADVENMIQQLPHQLLTLPFKNNEG